MNSSDSVDTVYTEELVHSPKNSIAPDQLEFGNCVLISGSKVIIRNLIVVLRKALKTTVFTAKEKKIIKNLNYNKCNEFMNQHINSDLLHECLDAVCNDDFILHRTRNEDCVDIILIFIFMYYFLWNLSENIYRTHRKLKTIVDSDYETKGTAINAYAATISTALKLLILSNKSFEFTMEKNFTKDNDVYLLFTHNLYLTNLIKNLFKVLNKKSQLYYIYQIWFCKDMKVFKINIITSLTNNIYNITIDNIIKLLNLSSKKKFYTLFLTHPILLDEFSDALYPQDYKHALQIQSITGYDAHIRNNWGIKKSSTSQNMGKLLCNFIIRNYKDSQLYANGNTDIFVMNVMSFQCMVDIYDKSNIIMSHIKDNSDTITKYTTLKEAILLLRIIRPHSIIATKESTLQKLKKLIETGDDLNFKNKDGDTLLIIASINNRIEIAENLIKAGADLNIQNYNGDTALIIAIKNNYIEIAKMFIDAEADLNIKDNNGDTALLWASINNRIEIAKMLIDAGADLNIQNYNGDTALIIAIKNNYIEIAKMLIKAGADLNIKNYNGYTALLWASKNNIEIAELLIKSGAELFTRNQDDETLLSLFINSNNIEVVKLLIEAGADLNIYNRNEYTPLIQAIENNNVEIAKFLIEAGANLNIQNYKRDDNTALIVAAEKNNIKIAELLIKAGADLNLQNTDGDTALMNSVCYNHTEILEMLIRAGADLNIKDDNDYSALILASENNDVKIAKILIEAGADLNIQNNDGDTALMFSVLYNHTEIAKMLIKAGADLNLQNNDGKNILNFSISTEMKKLFEYYNISSIPSLKIHPSEVMKEKLSMFREDRKGGKRTRGGKKRKNGKRTRRK
jgi:ankyrin repeat protein